MPDEAGAKSWFLTLPGLLTGFAALLTALAGVIAAVSGLLPKFESKPSALAKDDCLPGYVWRKALPEDHVCVTLETHWRTEQDNGLAGSRRDPAGGPFGPDSCRSGFVFRDAFPGDHICVAVETRTQAAEDNRQGPLRRKR